MNILFFISPKDKIDYVFIDFTLRQVLEKMDNCGFTSLPILNAKGEYIATITEGDILRHIKSVDKFSLRNAEKIPLTAINIKREVKSIKIYSNIEDLLELALDQNFVPVVDDMNHFIGIITRKAVLSHFAKNIKKEN